MRIICTILSIMIVSWLYVGTPLGFKKTFGEIRPLKESSKIPNMSLSGKTIIETMSIRKKQAEEMVDSDLSYGDAEWTGIHEELVSSFEDLKEDSCNEGLIKNYGAIVSTYIIYARENADVEGFKPVDDDLAETASRAISDSIYGKYLIRKDLSMRALRYFSLGNRKREACVE